MRKDSSEMDRRGFLLAGVASAMAPALPALIGAEKAGDASKLIMGKNPRLHVHSTEPLVFETPLDLLTRDKVTPKELIFVRNNQSLKGAATLKAMPEQNHVIKLTGLITSGGNVPVRALAKMPQVKRQMVLQCSGNGRSLFSKAAKTSGTQWGLGAVANVEFSGVRLSEILDRYKLIVGKRVRFVTARGMDSPAPGKEDFEHSLPIDDVLERSILATHLNGEPLPAIHGGPVRLVTPGFYATMNVKWLSELEFLDRESMNYNHVPRYRTPYVPIKPGTDFKATLKNSRPTWQMKLATVILSPSADAELRAGPVEVKGIAWNDGQARVTDVTVSFDQGKTWHKADLKSGDGPFAWSRWTITRRLKPGKHQIWARACDAFGRSQPIDGALFWNPRGYEWNGVSKVHVQVGG